MTRTQKTTRALARFGVYGRPGQDEADVLALANEFRRELAEIYHAEHEALIDLRNITFPDLFAALVERERLYFEIVDLEREIKAMHSDVRDRNAVTDEQRQRLESLRVQRAACNTTVKTLSEQWYDVEREFREHRKASCDNWQHVKTLDKRLELYSQIQWPERVQEFARIVIAADIDRRNLGRAYQQRGLHSAIRAEIVEATQPKRRKDSPGVRYRYGRRPELRPWTKLTLQFGGGGLSVADAYAGKCPQFRIDPVYVNHRASHGDVHVVRVTQQIGTKGEPREITYTGKLHRPLPMTAVLQRWTLIVEPIGKRLAVPLVSGMDWPVETQPGTLDVRLSWTVVQGGVRVATFIGDSVNEELVLPRWVIARRMGVAPMQTEADNVANEMLKTRGVSVSKQPGPGVLHGMESLREYCGSHEDDVSAINKLDYMDRLLSQARKDARRAASCIEKIYETAAHRVCRLHSQIVDRRLDLRRIKRYDTRDLLQEDPLPPASREIMHAVAPGKLQAAIDSYDLTRVASGDVVLPDPAIARETDVVTSYVRSLGKKTGSKRQRKCRRSQTAVEELVCQ